MVQLLTNPVVAVVVFLGILIFVHELGHFIVGRLCGIGVEIFSIGFGPKLFGFERNGTLYQVALLPLGGFVKFAGAYPDEEVKELHRGHELNKAGALARLATISAGPLANLLLALFVFAWLGARGIEHIPAKIGQIIDNSRADQSGLHEGDIIIEVGGVQVKTWDEMRDIIVHSAEKPLDFLINRQGETRSLTIVPESKIGENAITTKKEQQGRLGIYFSQIPPVITIKDPRSLASKSGLETGDYVVSVKPAGVDAIATDSWAKLEDSLFTSYQAGLRQFVLEVRKGYDPFAKKDQLEGELSSILLDASDIALSFDHGQSWRQNRQKLSAALGLFDSQLTVFSGPKSNDGPFVKGDQIVAFNGQKISNFFDLAAALEENTQELVTLSIVRKYANYELKVPLNPIETQRADGKRTVYVLDATFLGQDLSPTLYIEKYDTLWQQIAFGAKATAKYSRLIISSLYGLITGEVPLKALGGPVLIAKVAQDAASLGLEPFLKTLALISINLGLVNLFPIPALDGGQLLIVLFEAMRRRPLSAVALENFQRIGFVMIMALVVLATYNDFSRYWTPILKGLRSVFE